MIRDAIPFLDLYTEFHNLLTNFDLIFAWKLWKWRVLPVRQDMLTISVINSHNFHCHEYYNFVLVALSNRIHYSRYWYWLFLWYWRFYLYAFTRVSRRMDLSFWQRKIHDTVSDRIRNYWENAELLEQCNLFTFPT